MGPGGSQQTATITPKVGVPAATPSATPTITQPTTPNLGSYMPSSPTMGTASATGATATNVGTATSATAQNTVLSGNPNEMTADSAQNLSAITAADNPYIQLAKQSGMNTAASRGLQNSSLGAGAAEAAAVQAAAPLAEQNASEASTAALQNSQLQTQASEFNASQQNANQQLNAQLQTQTSQFNASNATQTAQFNTAAANAAKEQTQQIQATINQTGLQGLNANTLATIQGSVSLGIAAQQSVNSLLTSAQSGINAVLANNNISANTAGQAISAIKANLENSLAITNIIQGGKPTADPWAVPAAISTIGAGGLTFRNVA